MYQMTREAFHNKVFEFLEKPYWDSGIFRATVKKALQSAVLSRNVTRSLAHLFPDYSPQALASKLWDAKEVRNKIKVKDLGLEINAVITKLLRPYVPLILLPGSNEIVFSGDGKPIGIRAIYWSRRIGQTIVMEIRNMQGFDEWESGFLVEEPSQNIVGRIFGKDQPYEEFQHEYENLS